jgi:hypothetical protein
MAENESSNNILSRASIERRASDRWDKKTVTERLHTSSKYKHIFARYHLPTNDWSNIFNKLTYHQRNILLKGELIRTYDALANTDKTRIKNQFGLSRFSSKWFKLPSQDKKILLNSVLHNG